MIAFLYSLPDLGLAALFTPVIALGFVVAPLMRCCLFGQVSKAHSEIVRTTMMTVTGFTGLVLAFSLVQAQGNLRLAQQTVTGEALQLNQMDRLLVRYGNDQVSAIRKAVDVYGESIVVDEWPRLSKHDSSQRTATLFRALSQQIVAIEPAPGRETVIYAELVKLTEQLASSRDDRLTATDLALPPIFWEVIGLMTVLLTGFAAFTEPTPGNIGALGGLGAGLGLLITLVFIFDQPFLGYASVTPEPIAKALVVMQARTN